MQKIFIVAVILLSFANASFACCCAGGSGKSSLAASNGQKACQNIFSLITIDFSLLSPRATATDVNVGMPKHCMHWWGHHKCCESNCSQPCMPQCSPCPTCSPCTPCSPQVCPNCRTKSMTIDDNTEAMAPSVDKQDKMIPVSNKQNSKKSDFIFNTKTNLLRINFFHHSKI